MLTRSLAASATSCQTPRQRLEEEEEEEEELLPSCNLTRHAPTKFLCIKRMFLCGVKRGDTYLWWQHFFASPSFGLGLR